MRSITVIGIILLCIACTPEKGINTNSSPMAQSDEVDANNSVNGLENLDNSTVTEDDEAEEYSTRSLVPIASTILQSGTSNEGTPASSSNSFSNPESKTCYYRVTSKINGSSFYYENDTRLSGNWKYSAQGCATSSKIIKCNAEEVIVEVSGGRDVVCDFTLNIPGKNLFSDTHTYNAPRQVSLNETRARRESDYPLMIKDCDVGEKCYSIKSVNLYRLSRNKFKFVTDDNEGFGASAVTVRSEDYGYYQSDFEFRDYFIFEIMNY
jgi:hypothetical protein